MMKSAGLKKIMLVTPPYHYGLVDVLGRWIPLNFVYLAGAARQSGLSVEIYDALNKNHGYPEIEERFRESNADYIASTAITSTVNDAIRMLELAKKVNPAVVTVLGGVHASFMYEEVLNSSAAIDYIIIGEGESSFSELLTVLEQGGNPATVAGVAFRRGETIVTTAKRPLLTNIDDLPTAWDLLDWEDYTYNVIPNSRLGSISTSRGCDQDCIFCSQQRFWGKSWRGRDPKQVVDELEHLYRSYQVNVFQITDEYPTRDRERWEEILDLLVARELPVFLMMETRAPDLIRDREIIWKYRKAGIIHISLGLEGKDQARLDYLKKGMAADQAKQALELLSENGIISEVSFMLGFPDDTMQSVAQTLKLAQSLKPDNANFLAITPWPYSELYQEVKESIREWDYAKYNLIDPILEPEQMSMHQIEIALIDCFRKFYMGKIFDVMTMKDEFRRGYMVRATKLIMGSPFIFKKFGMLVVGRMPAKIKELKQKFNASDGS
jgi:anaerobic magnesium-protoporphyrin IX monomethyl ester cyclase